MAVARDDINFNALYRPTVLAPPRMTIGVPAYLPLAEDEVGGVKSNPCGLRLYSPTYAAVSATGNEEAPSKVMLGGICQKL